MKKVVILMFFTCIFTFVLGQSNFLIREEIFYGPGLNIGHDNLQATDWNTVYSTRSSSSAVNISRSIIEINAWGNVSPIPVIDSIPPNSNYRYIFFQSDKTNGNYVAQLLFEDLNGIRNETYLVFADSSGTTYWVKQSFANIHLGLLVDSDFVYYDDHQKHISLIDRRGNQQWITKVDDLPFFQAGLDSVVNIRSIVHHNGDLYLTCVSNSGLVPHQLIQLEIATGNVMASYNFSLSGFKNLISFHGQWYAASEQTKQNENQRLIIYRYSDSLDAILDSVLINENIAHVQYVSMSSNDSYILLLSNAKDSVTGIAYEAPEIRILSGALKTLNKRFLRATKTYFGGGNTIDTRSCSIREIVQTTDRGYVLTGVARPGTYDAHSYVLKLDSNLLSPDTFFLTGVYAVLSQPDSVFLPDWVGLETVTSQKDMVKVYPNPSADIVVVENAPLNSQLSIINQIGELVSVQVINNQPYQCHLTTLSKGIYFFKITSPHFHKVVKVVKS